MGEADDKFACYPCKGTGKDDPADPSNKYSCYTCKGTGIDHDRPELDKLLKALEQRQQQEREKLSKELNKPGRSPDLIAQYQAQAHSLDQRQRDETQRYIREHYKARAVAEEMRAEQRRQEMGLEDKPKRTR